VATFGSSVRLVRGTVFLCLVLVVAISAQGSLGAPGGLTRNVSGSGVQPSVPTSAASVPTVSSDRTPAPGADDLPCATLTGAGSTFIAPLMSSWVISASQESNGCLQVSYNAVGSGAGISDLLAKTVDFAASEYPLGSPQVEPPPAPVLTIPGGLGAVSVMYNLGATGANPLNLTGAILAEIYQGNITNWDDASIAALNPGLTLPDLNITTVHRLDGSGTTFVFTSFLSQASPWWKANVGAGLSIAWPNLATSSLAERGSAGVAAAVANNQGSIGYAELDYAKIAGVSYAAIENPAGNFVLPDVASTQAAAEAAASTLPNGSGNWSDVSLVNELGGSTYPLASFTYLLVYRDLGQAYGSALNLSEAQALASFLWYITHDGQDQSAGLFYAPLPSAIVNATCGPALDDLQYDGRALNPHPQAATTYAVTFSEQGLAESTAWSVQLNGTLGRSTTPYIIFDEPNGTYPYTISPPNDFNVSSDVPSPVVVSGGAVTVLVAFSAIMSVRFTEATNLTERCDPDTATLSFIGGVQGGAPPYTFTWDFGDGSALGHGPNVTHTYTHWTAANVTLWVIDAHGSNASQTAPPEPAPAWLCATPSTFDPWDVIVLFLVVAFAIAVPVVWTVTNGRKHRRQGPPPPKV
jgi:phosphate ABC transporter phosphate-binding protein